MDKDFDIEKILAEMQVLTQTPPRLGGGYATAPKAPLGRFETQAGMLDQIKMRLRIPEGATLGFDFIAAHKAGDKALVFVVQNDKHEVLEDEWALFPSDTLTTKLRLLEKSK